MELRQLKYFITVAEELNFRRAAERLYMEQPPLSRQIRQLEEELGVELFHRSKRGVALTEAGKAFLDEARLTLAQAERAAKAARQAIAMQARQITIGFSICAFNEVLPEIIQAFRQKFPEVKLSLTEMSTELQIQALLQETIDIGFIHGPIQQPGIETVTLLREPLIVALPPMHPLANRETIDLGALKNESFILCPQHIKPDLYAQVMHLCQQAGFQPNVVQEASPPEVLLALVESGMGVSLVAAGAKTRHKLSVVYLPLTETTPGVEIAAAWNKDRQSVFLQHFLQLVKYSAHASIGSDLPIPNS
ncbi:hypothetical protein WA1_26185 [Scytonema hofmannii PCC 7110]|uniref:HTH lysR-type domain-containing protein n=1 Tax=Scytonema hofmannii PCC 7110 TaxID=128403 RepID=A0A139X7D1_9CYAN|nr:LysR family transcriptional regulator [Scytonema hofmannii]KYC40608.1 hypothetical protein WA1_26185 [Scytonema hofmannii PCC 7110]